MYITGSGAPIWVVWSGLILTINLGSVDVIFYVFHERKKTKYSIDDDDIVLMVLWIKISLKLSLIVLFKIIEHKQTQIVTIQALSNMNTTLDF